MSSTASSKTVTVSAKEGKKLFYMAMPFIALVFVFNYLPLYGWLYAFFDYKLGHKLFDSEFKGFFFFKMILSDPITVDEVKRIMSNTLGISFLSLLVQVLPLIFALFLVEMKFEPLKKVVQTLTTLPNFLSWPLVYAFAFSMFSESDGFINKLLIRLHIIDDPISFLVSSNHVWLTQTAYLAWKTIGWTAIIYIAAVTSIDNELYEAARIDGAGRFRIMWSITVPHLMPTFFVLMMLSVANFLNNGLDQYLVFQNAMNTDSIEVLDLYVYNVGIRNGMSGYNYSFATAVGILKSVVSIVLLFSVNYASKKVRGEGII
ncbi:ABC transporter permease [Paenibacillus silvisoli]|uniref:ABC transporter permease n=1 Tax=Paenibacillus silvisoli TaxID=3110539 RepID=UPI0028063B9B|nr:ABC transporter permease subunit [Paenibacillus silvisoli]